ncbi:MAG: spore maturation protein [Deltaproteobacteria bacterium]|nr:spore maturation protein [Deltaproteobacteria bacterium]
MLNGFWIALVLGAVVVGAWSGQMQAVSGAALASAKSAIQLVIGLTGAMMLFLGLVRIAARGGLLRAIARALRPLLLRLFPDVPPDHPAMGAMIMNFAANMLGLGNAATPFGIKAMAELERLNTRRGSATNAMALFLAINTSSIVLMAPTGTVALRAAAGSEAPFAIWLPTLFATLCSTCVAVFTCLVLQRLPWFAPRAALVVPGAVDKKVSLNGGESPGNEVELPDGFDALEAPAPGRRWRDWRSWLVVAVLAALAVPLALQLAEAAAAGELWPALRDQVASHWLLPLLIAGLVLIGLWGGAPIYEAMIEGAKEGLGVALRIAPYLLAILVAVGMFRASGALALVVGALDPATSLLGVPAEALPMALLRPLSGSGAYAVMAEALQTHGPDSFVGMLVSTLQGSTETTFYVLAVYLGAVGVRDSRHILPACLAGDLAGFIGAVAATHLFFG